MQAVRRYLALGICDALRDAELLANAIEDGLTARRPIDQALAEYERRLLSRPPLSQR
jgi:2-polyprenyl-6-methoxyphenol hydroxylase-like FAD-dependent oxidoreductase